MSFEDQLRSELGGIRVPEALSPPADLADTVLVGIRRQSRRRGLLAAGCLVIAVAVVSLSANFWRSPQPAPGPMAPTTTAPTDRACGGPLPSRPPSSTREYFDPLTLEIDAGGVTGYQVKATVGQIYYQGLEMINSAGNRSIAVLVYAAGGEPHYYDAGNKAIPFDPGAGALAGIVRGARAFWLPNGRFTPSDTNPQGIAWQWASGAWAFVIASEIPPRDATPAASTVDRAGLRALAAQIAPQLTLGVSKPVTGPFSMRVPDCTRLTISVTAHDVDDHGVPYTAFLLGFDTADTVDPTYPPAGDTQTSLVVMADTAEGPKNSDTLTKYPGDLGHPAYVSGDGLSVYEVAGFAVNVWPFAMPNADTEAAKVSVAADIFRTMTFYPGAADSEAAWGDPIIP